MVSRAASPTSTSPLLSADSGSVHSDSATSDKVKKVAKISFGNRVCAGVKGFFTSRVVLAVVLAAAVPVCLFLLVSNPFGWAISGLIAIKVALSVLAAAGAGGYLWKNKKGNFEAKAVLRMLPGVTNLNVIYENDKGHKLYLSALPNKLHFSEVGEALGEEGAVLSINEPWETKPVGLSQPLSEDEWEGMDVTYKQIEVKDHTLLTPQQMDDAANYIYEGLQKGNVLVHCRGGVGRSATAIAAFFMKYTVMSIEEIVVGIMESRPQATIWDKVGALRRYDEELRKNPLSQRPPISYAINEIADALDGLEKEGKTPKISKLPSEKRVEIEGHKKAILKSASDGE